MSGDQPFYPATGATRAVSVLGHFVGRVWRSTDPDRPGIMASGHRGSAIREKALERQANGEWKSVVLHRVFPDVKRAAKHLILLWGSDHCEIKQEAAFAPMMTPALPEENR